MMATKLSYIYARICPSRIYYLRFILEGYDGLAVLSTVSTETGLVLLRFPKEARAEVVALLDDMANALTSQGS